MIDKAISKVDWGALRLPNSPYQPLPKFSREAARRTTVKSVFLLVEKLAAPWSRSIPKMTTVKSALSIEAGSMLPTGSSMWYSW